MKLIVAVDQDNAIGWTDGRQRTYHPDFILGDKIIELKPSSLVSTKENQAKFEAARAQFGASFIVLTDDDVERVSLDKLVSLVQTGTVKLIAKYHERLNAYIPPDQVL